MTAIVLVGQRAVGEVRMDLGREELADEVDRFIERSEIPCPVDHGSAGDLVVVGSCVLGVLCTSEEHELTGRRVIGLAGLGYGWHGGKLRVPHGYDPARGCFPHWLPCRAKLVAALSASVAKETA